MSPRLITRALFQGPAGGIEGLVHRGSSAPRFVAVAAHPHPLHGGTMDNKVTWRLARGLEDAGGLVVRFNFRGVGRSEGEHDGGAGEQDDIRAAAAFARDEAGGTSLPLVLAGFSFGSAVSSRVAASSPPGTVAGLVLVGAPLLRHTFAELDAVAAPVGIVQGDGDSHGPVAAARALALRLGERGRLAIVEGAGHFFEGRGDELQAAVKALATTGPLGTALGLAGGAAP